MATKFLSQKQSKKSFSENLNKVIGKLLRTSENSVKKKIAHKSSIIPSTSKDLSSLIEKYQKKLNRMDTEKPSHQIASNIEKLKKAKRISMELQKPEPENTKKHPTNFQSRKEFQESEQKKAEEIAKALKKYKKQQRALEEGMQKQLKKIEKKLKQQKDEEKFNEQYEIFMRKERIKDEREKMLEKKQKRLQEQEDLKKAKSDPNIHLAKKPLFQIYEEKFNAEVLMPELERRKAELKKKREMLSPLSTGKLKEHASWYKNFKDSLRQKFEQDLSKRIEDQKKRENLMPESFWRTVEENESELRMKERIKMIEKSKNYAEMVQELYYPALDLGKNSEKKEKGKDMKKKKKKKKNSVKEVKSDGDASEQHKWKPKKFKPNTLVPEQKLAKVVKVQDYLTERRQKRESLQTFQKSLTLSPQLVTKSLASNDLELFKKNSLKIDEIVRKRSLYLSSLPKSVYSLAEAESLDTLLLDSIKSKLSLISTISRKNTSPISLT